MRLAVTVFCCSLPVLSLLGSVRFKVHPLEVLQASVHASLNDTPQRSGLRSRRKLSGLTDAAQRGSSHRGRGGFPQGDLSQNGYSLSLSLSLFPSLRSSNKSAIAPVP